MERHDFARMSDVELNAALGELTTTLARLQVQESQLKATLNTTITQINAYQANIKRVKDLLHSYSIRARNKAAIQFLRRDTETLLNSSSPLASKVGRLLQRILDDSNLHELLGEATYDSIKTFYSEPQRPKIAVIPTVAHGVIFIVPTLSRKYYIFAHGQVSNKLAWKEIYDGLSTDGLDSRLIAFEIDLDGAVVAKPVALYAVEFGVDIRPFIPSDINKLLAVTATIRHAFDTDLVTIGNGRISTAIPDLEF